ncbi:MAG: protein kinase domain-containing protein [Kofleriaceae bacterium]
METRTVKKPTPFGKYFLLERINVGGMAEVFRAKAFGVEGFERLVAVKRILPNIAEDKEFIRMFIEEAKLSVQLNHANIAQIFDLGVVDGSYYIALEHVHGRDLRGIFDRCRQLGEAMPVAQACFMVMKLCEGLDYAHNKRDQSGRELSLVHRDVSPQNVLVSFEGEVKIIDFGIAKAAGKGSKTQAGILKGKFGYMSPEQVRGLPVDRRSDVFSCGIVLYELLTGERLFVGESDFSTLEKVRNVEILPPSTYNRKIPDELERIVLKALSKDVEDRYQNAIDLHDELQAFVYTAGEFYSRKDLAGWMKKTFGKEIEEETAKLESYRQLKPPPAEAAPPPPPSPSRTMTGSRPPTTSAPAAPPPRRTQAMPAVAAPGTKPPPPPPSPRMSQQMPAIQAPAPVAPAPAPLAAAPFAARSRNEDSGDLSWDDDELETQIYDPEDDPRLKQPSSRSKPLPLQAPVVAAAVEPPPASPSGPDLSSLVSTTSKGWEVGPAAPSPASTMNGMGLGQGAPPGAPPRFPTGSAKTVAPEPPPSSTLPGGPRLEPSGAPVLFDSAPRELAAPGRLVSTGMPAPSAGMPMPSESAFDPMGSFGAGVTRRTENNPGIQLIAVGGAVVAAIAVVAVLALTGDKKANPKTEVATQQPAPTAPATTGADQNTGFDLYVSPPGVTQWRLDGEARTDRLPSRIRGIEPGPHKVQIDPPPGFMGQTQPVTVESGKAGKIEIVLQPIEGLRGSFESNPPGATVSLIVDGNRQPLGESPASAPLDPRKSYLVLFEKPGYVSVNRPLSFTGAVEEKLVVNLEKASAVASSIPEKNDKPEVRHVEARNDKTEPKVKTEPKIKNTAVRTPGEVEPKPDKPEPKPEPRVADAAPKGQGILMLGSKPSCEIYVDGSATGLHTPQREMKLSAGKHRITLVNNEFGIKESFAVDIKPDTPAKMIKDYSDRLPK